MRPRENSARVTDTPWEVVVIRKGEGGRYRQLESGGGGHTQGGGRPVPPTRIWGDTVPASHVCRCRFDWPGPRYWLGPGSTCGCHLRPARGDTSLAGAIGRSRSLVLERPAALLPVAVVAVHGSVAPGKEWDLCVLATLGAHRGVHLAPHSATVPTTTTAVITPGRTPGLPAGRASLGLVCVALLRMILLVVYTKNETLTALHAS